MFAAGPKAMHDEEERHEQLPSEEIKRRLIEKAELLAELEARNPRSTGIPTEQAPAAEAPALTSRITADGRKLASLASRAKKLEEIADRLSEKANAAKQAANQARGELGSYMASHGLLLA